MKHGVILNGLTLAWLSLVISEPQAAQGADPDWPCMQRKVVSLSLSQVWRGPPLNEANAGSGETDEAVRKLASALLDRRKPVEEAERLAADYARSLRPVQRDASLYVLVTALLDHANAERSQIIAGISRYAHRQMELASRVRQEAASLSVLRQDPKADPDEVARKTQELAINARVFQERVQSLRTVCEVPVELEQRLFAILETIRKNLPN